MPTSFPPGPPDGPEYLTAGPDKASPRRRRGLLLAVASAATLAVAGVGGWAALGLRPDGDQPATAVPASALGYVSLDLDPTAEQKVEALRVLRKFPAVEEKLSLGAGDDLRRWFFEAAVADSGGCFGLDYVRDVAPWVGDRAALALLPAPTSHDLPARVAVLEVTDRDRAAAGIDRVTRCADAGREVDLAFAGDYAVLSDGEVGAGSVVASAERASLADDAAFTRWTGAAGDPGIVTLYAAPEAPGALADVVTSRPHGPWTTYGQAPPPQLPGERLAREAKRLYADFAGAAAVLRFADGAVEMEVAAGGLPRGPAAGRAPDLASLPTSTAAAVGVGLRPGWLVTWLDSLTKADGPGGPSTDDLLARAEALTGLALPEDLETLLGEGVSLSVRGDVDLAALGDLADPRRVPVGVRVTGDPARIMPVVHRLRASLGPDAGLVHVRKGDGVVAFAPDPGYAEDLVAAGGLGDTATYAAVLPGDEAPDAALFVDFDAECWLDRLARKHDEAAAADPRRPGPMLENVRPLRALGLSAWTDGDVQRGLLRLSTD